MNINSLEFSYPVLSSYTDDYISSEFKVEYEIEEKGFNSKSLRIKFNIKDNIIEKYLEEKEFKILVHVECSQTSYRKVYNVDNNIREINIPIDTDTMRSLVEISSFIVCNKDIKEYRNKNINKRIYGNNYCIKNLKKGNIIAATYTEVLDIKVEQDDFESFSSIIKVGLSKDKFKEVDLDDEIIIIHLPEKQYMQYNRLSETIYSDIILTSVIYPSLVYTLDQLSNKDNIPIYRELTWFKSIESKLALKDIEIEDINEIHSSVKLAQMILESPLERALNSIEEKIEEED